MKASKYPLESCGCHLPFWYSTLSYISDWTTPDFNLLTAARSQDRSDIVIGFFFLLAGDADGLSIAICDGASKSYAPTHNLATYHWILLVMVPYCGYVSMQNFEPNCLYDRFSFPSNVESFSLKNLGDLLFDQVILMLFLVSCILAQSTKIWRHYIIAFLHCTIPHASSHKYGYNLEQERVSIWCNLECILYNLVVS
jgi:hypothetical protein